MSLRYKSKLDGSSSNPPRLLPLSSLYLNHPSTASITPSMAPSPPRNKREEGKNPLASSQSGSLLVHKKLGEIQSLQGKITELKEEIKILKKKKEKEKIFQGVEYKDPRLTDDGRDEEIFGDILRNFTIYDPCTTFGTRDGQIEEDITTNSDDLVSETATADDMSSGASSDEEDVPEREEDVSEKPTMKEIDDAYSAPPDAQPSFREIEGAYSFPQMSVPKQPIQKNRGLSVDQRPLQALAISPIQKNRAFSPAKLAYSPPPASLQKAKEGVSLQSPETKSQPFTTGRTPSERNTRLVSGGRPIIGLDKRDRPASPTAGKLRDRMKLLTDSAEKDEKKDVNKDDKKDDKLEDGGEKEKKTEKMMLAFGSIRQSQIDLYGSLKQSDSKQTLPTLKSPSKPSLFAYESEEDDDSSALSSSSGFSSGVEDSGSKERKKKKSKKKRKGKERERGTKEKRAKRKLDKIEKDTKEESRADQKKDPFFGEPSNFSSSDESLCSSGSFIGKPHTLSQFVIQLKQNLKESEVERDPKKELEKTVTSNEGSFAAVISRLERLHLMAASKASASTPLLPLHPQEENKNPSAPSMDLFDEMTAVRNTRDKFSGLLDLFPASTSNLAKQLATHEDNESSTNIRAQNTSKTKFAKHALHLFDGTTDTSAFGEEEEGVCPEREEEISSASSMDNASGTDVSDYSDLSDSGVHDRLLSFDGVEVPLRERKKKKKKKKKKKSKKKNDEMNNWTQRFRNVTLKLSQLEQATTSEKTGAYLQQCFDVASEMIHLSQDFVHAARTYGKIIISEVFMEHKSIKPVNVGGRAGGDKYIVNNILFKFALDSSGLFNGNHHHAAKVAGHELKGAISLYSLGIMSVSFPLLALVDYRGFRLIAISILPLKKGSLIYGTMDGGITIHKSNKEMSRYMQRAAKKLNLKPHICGLKKGETKHLWSAADLEGHLGTDGNLYLLDFARTLPPTRPSRLVHNGHLFQMFRKDFLAQYPKPLCPDASSSFIINDPDIKVHNVEVSEATDFLENVFIPSFAKDWLGVTIARDKEGEVSRLNPSDEMHRRAINMRYLGLAIKGLFSSLPESETAILLLLVECVSRIVKNRLQRRLQKKMVELKLPLEMPYRKVVIDFMNVVFSSQTEESKKFWEVEVRKDMVQYFNFSNLDDQFYENLQTKILGKKFSDGMAGIKLVFNRVRELTGLRFTAEAESKLVSGKSWVSHQPLDLWDLIEIGERVKYMDIVNKAEAKFLLFRAFEATQLQLTENAEYLYSETLNKLAASLSSNADDLDALFTSCIARYKFLDGIYRTSTHQEMNFDSSSLDVIQLDRLFRRALELSPNNTEVNSTYAIFLERCGQVEEAEDIYLKIFEGQKESAFALISYGNFLLRKGQILPANILFANAMNHCQNSNEITSPFDGSPLTLATRVYLEDGTFKTVRVNSNTTSDEIKRMVIKLILSKMSKMLADAQLEKLADKLEAYSLILYGESLVTTRVSLVFGFYAPPFTLDGDSFLKSEYKTRHLQGFETPWIYLQRELYGDQCKLYFRPFNDSDEQNPVSPFNVPTEYCGMNGRDFSESDLESGSMSLANKNRVNRISTLARIKRGINLNMFTKKLGRLGTLPPAEVAPPANLVPVHVLAHLNQKVESFFKEQCLVNFLKYEGESSFGHFPKLEWILVLTSFNYHICLLSYSLVASRCGKSCPSSEIVTSARAFAKEQFANPLIAKACSQDKRSKKSEREILAILLELNYRLLGLFEHVYNKHNSHIVSLDANPIIQEVVQMVGLFILDIFSVLRPDIDDSKLSRNIDQIIGEVEFFRGFETGDPNSRSELVRSCILLFALEEEGSQARRNSFSGQLPTKPVPPVS